MILWDLTQRPKRHSYSAIKQYKQCPAAYAYRYIQKLPDEPTAAMQRGTRLHKLCEDYMNAGNEVPTPYDVKRIGLKLYQLRERKAKAEEVWLVNKDWDPVEHDAQARLKCIVDVHWLDSDVLRLHDYKSGRPYADHDAQLELYRTVGLQRYPDARRAESSALYIDSGNEGPMGSTIREMLPHLTRKWTGDMDRIDGDERFLPTAGGHCQRCGFRDSEGGPCHAWREQ